MITRAYKNHNVTFKFERGDYVPDHIGDMVEELAFRADAFDVSDVFAPESWGNAYAVYPLHITANGFTGVYYFGPYDFDAARAGKTVRLICDREAPAFVMPSFYKYQNATRADGVKGCVYTLCDPLPDEIADDMRAAGCDVLVSVCEYAPEIKHAAVFVPRGVCFEFC